MHPMIPIVAENKKTGRLPNLVAAAETNGPSDQQVELFGNIPRPANDQGLIAEEQCNLLD